ncbi:MAG: hypothetical protein OXE53_22940, partial [Deltaproteobacteria bacterium]|nr:hypothetical protein [Deltaproteobacteria bacterium]
MLTEDAFTYDGVSYEVIRLHENNGTLTFRVNKAIPDGLKSALTLRVGANQYALLDATYPTSGNGAEATWSNAALFWSAGDSVQLILSEPPPSPEPPPAIPSTTVTLVSNTGQGLSNSGNISVENWINAQGFTTGPAKHGYALTSIELPVRLLDALSATDVRNFVVGLWSDSNGVPGTKVADLAPVNFPTGTTGIHTVSFEPKATTTLAANTTYHFVIYMDAGLAFPFLYVTYDMNEDAGAADGWSIEDAASSFLGTGIPLSTPTGPSDWTSSPYTAIQIGVKGFPAPASRSSTPTDTDMEVAIWSATLAVRDLANDGTLLGCSNGTSYAAGDRCNSQNSLMEDSFTLGGNDFTIDALFSEYVSEIVPRSVTLSFDGDSVPSSLRHGATLVFDGRALPLSGGEVQTSGATIKWADTGIGVSDYEPDQVIEVSLRVSRPGPDVSDWNPTVFVQELGADRYGCRSGVTVSAMPGRSGGAECSVPANFGGNEFSVSHVRFGTRGYRVLDLYIEPHRSTSWGETAYRVVLRVDDDSGTAELGRGMSLVLTTPGVTEKRLPFNAAERDGNTFRWPLFFDDGALGWDQGWVRGVKVRIHQFTAGLDYVRVHYDEMRGGQPVDGFGAWLPARVSAYFPDRMVAY